MNRSFKDYFWKNGKPYGKSLANPQDPVSYRIVADPYYKRLTVEKYCEGKFFGLIYDSLLLDFRHLKEPEQQAWLREVLEERSDQMKCLIRNQDDRAILVESLTFEQNRCRSCQLSSIHGIPLSIHRMYYQSLNDPFDGVVLYDIEDRAIMKKLYTVDPQTSEFDALISEDWNMEHYC